MRYLSRKYHLLGLIVILSGCAAGTEGCSITPTGESPTVSVATRNSPTTVSDIPSAEMNDLLSPEVRLYARKRRIANDLLRAANQSIGSCYTDFRSILDNSGFEGGGYEIVDAPSVAASEPSTATRAADKTAFQNMVDRLMGGGAEPSEVVSVEPLNTSPQEGEQFIPESSFSDSGIRTIATFTQNFESFRIKDAPLVHFSEIQLSDTDDSVALLEVNAEGDIVQNNTGATRSNRPIELTYYFTKTGGSWRCSHMFAAYDSGSTIASTDGKDPCSKFLLSRKKREACRAGLSGAAPAANAQRRTPTPPPSW